MLGRTVVALTTGLTELVGFLMLGKSRSSANHDDSPDTGDIPTRRTAVALRAGSRTSRDNPRHNPATLRKSWTAPNIDEMLYGLNETSPRTASLQEDPFPASSPIELSSVSGALGGSQLERGATTPLQNAIRNDLSKPDPLVAIESVTPVAEVLLEPIICR